ncbi:amino acid adenylation domain-containing protein [Croceifilum oryzae]|uniref:Amino acid adenylation domain-containing protein n=1 Tax=Croceifilum oryzae TaxID=1553429 RepID=A0AAJ1WTD3_9BACL|nr:non-ribosomal peptide synthetase [Croceifilum oryzae]MDQ0418690.1 amino acid adenylation domain-containing protein [Croceifilum oryzae]
MEKDFRRDQWSLSKQELLAKILEGKKSLSKEESIQRYEGDRVPVSFAQKRLWFLDQLYPGSPAYNVTYTMRLRGVFHIEAMRRSIEELVARHEGLRTTFHKEHDQPFQVIAEKVELAMPCVDVTHMPTEKRETKAMQLLLEEMKTPFVLDNGPLIRVVFVKLDEQDHFFLLNIHHIVFDGWSAGVFFKDLSTLYEAYSRRQELVQLPELPLRYVDYTHWQQNWFKGGELDRQLEYWEEQLGGELPVLNLPYDRPRPTQQTFQGSLQHFTIPASLLEKLKELSQQEGVSLFMTLLSAFKALMYRYTRQEDILIASPIANRTRSEWEKVVGFFANTLVLRTDLSGTPSFRELLQRVQQVTLSAYSNQDVPFEQIVEKLMPNRDLSMNPIFQIMFNFVDLPEETQFHGLETQFLDIDNGTTKFDFEVQLTENKDGIHGRFEYSTDLFDESTIQRMMAHYHTLLEGIAQDREQSIAEYNLLQEEERHLLLHEWNETDADYPADMCLHQLFEEQVEKTPDEIAVIFEGKSTSYRELNQRANGFAQRLRQLGVGAEVKVGVCLRRSLETVVAVLGILKAGGAYVSLDPNEQTERLQHFMEDAQLSLIITNQHLDSVIPDSTVPRIHIDQMWNELELLDENVVSRNPDSLIYIVYTSGTTGKPKGIAMTHRPLMNLITWQTKKWIHPAKARSLQFSSLGFDMSCFEFFTTFIAGGTLVIPTDEERNDPERLLALLTEERVERAYFPYVALQQLAELSLQSNSNVMLAIKLREIAVAGEQLRLSPNIVDFLKRLDGCVLHNHYGPSEAHVIASYPVMIEEEQRVLAPVGRPIANTKIYLLDQQMKPVPIGVSGEVYVAGVCLARGYINLPDKTEERFVSNPFSTDPHAKMYRTGDLARYLPDGNIQFLGRVDDQVKIRGYRVEPGEIEVVLQKAPAIQEVIVIAKEEAPGRMELIAYYVASQKLESEELRTYLLSKLPDYMVPVFYVQLEEMPLTSGGKVNRRALPEPDRTSGHQAMWQEPETPVEQKLALIWEEVLGRTAVSREDHFFRLGGHSLLATQVISRVRTRFQVEVPLRLIFEVPILKDLAKRIEQEVAQQPLSSKEAIQPYPREHTMLASYAQHRLWFLDQLNPASTAYHMPYAVHLQGHVDIEAMRRSVQMLVDRHEGLRTNFVKKDDQPFQVIAEKLELDMPCIDVTHLPKEEREAEAMRLLVEDAKAPFDLQQDPLIRVKLIRLDEQAYFVSIHFHHIIMDGWSAGIFFKELAALYEGEILQTKVHLPELDLQYVDYAEWQREWLRGEVLESQLKYWEKQLDGELAVLALPYDYTRPSKQWFHGDVHYFTLPASLHQKLKELSQQEEASLYMTLLAAFKVLVYRYTHQEDIVVAAPIANRTRSEWDGVIGFFANTVVLRTDLSGIPSFRELLQRVRRMTLDAYSNQDVPFEKVVEKLMPNRDVSMNPLFQVMFNYIESTYETEFYGLKSKFVDVDNDTAKFDFEVQIMETSDGIEGRVEYSTDLFDGTSIERMIMHYHTLLEELVVAPEQSILEYNLLQAEERHLLLHEWNQTAVDYPADRCLHHVFEEQVIRTPDEVAVIFRDESITYRELNQRANGLAQRLRQFGVGAETRVGICLSRSIEMVVSVLATLKAGGAYVSLDPQDHRARLQYIVEDAQLILVLTQMELDSLIPSTTAAQKVYLDLIWDELDWNDENRDSCTPENLMYLVYTSGSTGKPKGVELTHRAMVNLVTWQKEKWVHSQKARVLQFASLSFDMSCLEFFATFDTGSTLILTSEDDRTDPERLLSLLSEQEVERSYFPYVALQQLAEVAIQRDVLDLKLREILVAGEQLNLTTQIVQFLKRLDGCVLHNHYGPSETHVVTTYPVCPFKEKRTLPPIGRPIANTKVYILDSKMRPVPIGVPGELYFSGFCLARGYFHQPEMTQERFIMNPFSGDPSEKLYKTGDLARYLLDGNIQYLGRVDDQVKIRGYRVESGEIEVTMLRYPGLVEAVVVARTDLSSRIELVAYYVANEKMDPDSEKIRSYLVSQLPDYMVPTFYIQLAEMPLTSSGKIDRRSLPKPDLSANNHTARWTEPATPIEQKLALIWEDVLERTSIGRDDHFFRLGGHSLLATRIISRIRRDFQIDVPLQLIFEAPILKDLAIRIEQATTTAGNAQAPRAIKRQPRKINSRIKKQP